MKVYQIVSEADDDNVIPFPKDNPRANQSSADTDGNTAKDTDSSKTSKKPKPITTWAALKKAAKDSGLNPNSWTGKQWALYKARATSKGKLIWSVVAGPFRPMLQLLLPIPVMVDAIYLYNKAYLENDCNINHPDVIDQELAVRDLVTGTILSMGLSGAYAGGTVVKRFIDAVRLYRTGAAAGAAGTGVGIVLSALIFGVTEAAIYFIGKLLGSAGFLKGLGNLVMDMAFQPQQMVRYGDTIWGYEGFGACKADLSVREETVAKAFSDEEIKSDIKDTIKSDPKMMAFVKKMQQAKKEKSKKSDS